MAELQAQITTTGQQVLLNTDGTWRFADGTQTAIAPTGSGGFRRSAWGSTAKEIVAAEGRKPDVKEDGALGFECKIAGLNALAIFTTIGNQLVRGKYAITEEHSNDTLFLNDFEDLGALLAKKYGDPYDDQTIWTDDDYRDEPAEWGMAVSMGQLARFRRWRADGTEVLLAITGDNFDVHLGVEYISTELGHLEDQAKEQAALDDL